MSYAFARTLPELARDTDVHPIDYTDFAERLMQQVEAGQVEVVVFMTHGWKIPAVIPPRAIPWKTNER